MAVGGAGDGPGGLPELPADVHAALDEVARECGPFAARVADVIARTSPLRTVAARMTSRPNPLPCGPRVLWTVAPASPLLDYAGGPDLLWGLALGQWRNIAVDDVVRLLTDFGSNHPANDPDRLAAARVLLLHPRTVLPQFQDPRARAALARRVRDKGAAWAYPDLVERLAFAILLLWDDRAPDVDPLPFVLGLPTRATTAVTPDLYDLPRGGPRLVPGTDSPVLSAAAWAERRSALVTEGPEDDETRAEIRRRAADAAASPMSPRLRQLAKALARRLRTTPPSARAAMLKDPRLRNAVAKKLGWSRRDVRVYLHRLEQRARSL